MNDGHFCFGYGQAIGQNDAGVTVPQPLKVGQSFVITGEADGYANGAQLVLRVDQQYELARPEVQVGKWQAVIGFNQAGSRLLEISGTGQDRAQITITITGTAPPRLPKVSFTNLPQTIRVEQAIVLQGGAENYSDGAELVLRVDQKSELARPKVQGGKWQATALFHQSGKRLVEIVGSEQDRGAARLMIARPSGTYARQKTMGGKKSDTLTRNSGPPLSVRVPLCGVAIANMHRATNASKTALRCVLR